MKRYYPRLIFFSLLAFLVVPEPGFAHCPLCTLGAGLFAGAAAYFGVDLLVVGVVLGGFSWVLGRWLAGTVRRRWGELVPGQNLLLTVAIYVSIIYPVFLGTAEYSSFFLSVAGDYGSWLNRTYVINSFLLGSLLGLVSVAVAPPVSSLLSRLRGDTYRFQGLTLTLVLLLLATGLTWLLTV